MLRGCGEQEWRVRHKASPLFSASLADSGYAGFLNGLFDIPGRPGGEALAVCYPPPHPPTGQF